MPTPIIDISRVECPESRLPAKTLLVTGALGDVARGFYRQPLAELAPRYNMTLHGVDLIPPRDAWRIIGESGLAYDHYSCDWPELKPDGVLVLTRPHSHLDMIQRALAAGVPVFVEKPIVMPGHLAPLEALRRDHRQRIFAIDHFFDRPGGFKAVEVVEQGRLGRVHSVTGTLIEAAPIKPALAWLLDPAISGGGAIIDLMVHVIVMGELFLGCLGHSLREFRFADGDVSCSRYPGAPFTAESSAQVLGVVDDIAVEFSVARGAGDTRKNFVIEGERGTLIVKYGIKDRSRRPFVELRRTDGRVDLHEEFDRSEYRSIVRKVFDSIHALGHVTQTELDYRFATTTLAVALADRMRSAYLRRGPLHADGVS